MEKKLLSWVLLLCMVFQCVPVYGKEMSKITEFEEGFKEKQHTIASSIGIIDKDTKQDNLSKAPQNVKTVAGIDYEHTYCFSNAKVLAHNKVMRTDLTKEVTEDSIFKIIKETSSEEVNKWWKEVMKYDNPPYKPGTIVKEIELTDKTTFVRVYDGEKSGMYGGWLMKAEGIKGLTPAQIKDKFALPSIPKYVVDVNLDAGTHIRTGVVNSLEGWGSGGGIQFDLIGQRIGKFVNSRELP